MMAYVVLAGGSEVTAMLASLRHEENKDQGRLLAKIVTF
jgi:hypothetical protein